MTNTLSCCFRLCVVGGFPFSSSPRLCVFFVFVVDREPYQQQKAKNDELGEEEKESRPQHKTHNPTAAAKSIWGDCLSSSKSRRGFLAMCPRHESINRAAHDEHSFLLFSALCCGRLSLFLLSTFVFFFVFVVDRVPLLGI